MYEIQVLQIVNFLITCKVINKRHLHISHLSNNDHLQLTTQNLNPFKHTSTFHLINNYVIDQSCSSKDQELLHLTTQWLIKSYYQSLTSIAQTW